MLILKHIQRSMHNPSQYKTSFPIPTFRHVIHCRQLQATFVAVGRRIVARCRFCHNFTEVRNLQASHLLHRSAVLLRFPVACIICLICERHILSLCNEQYLDQWFSLNLLAAHVHQDMLGAFKTRCSNNPRPSANAQNTHYSTCITQCPLCMESAGKSQPSALQPLGLQKSSLSQCEACLVVQSPYLFSKCSR